MFANLYDQSGAAKKRRRRRKANRDSPAEASSSSAMVDASQARGKRKSSNTVPPPQSKRARRQGPSEAALALSTKLKEYSSQKRLKEALDLYRHESNDLIRDGHHACIVIDCCSRCGCIEVSMR